MSLTDKLILIDPLPCYLCASTADDEVGSDAKEGVIEIGEESLKTIRLHDGKGGLKEFQIGGFGEGSMDEYFFPGFIPREVVGGLIGKHLDRPVATRLIEICNMCDEAWEGNLYLYEQGDVYRMEMLDIWPDDETKQLQNVTWKTSPLQTKNYSVEANNNRIQLFPEDKQATATYTQRSNTLDEKTDFWETTLQGISHPEVPLKKIIAYLSRRIAKRKKPPYSDNLAQAISDYQNKQREENLTRSAFETALIILHRYDRNQALQIVEMAGIASAEKFEEDIRKYHDWYFTGKNDAMSLFGSFDGPNDFLGHLKKAKKK